MFPWTLIIVWFLIGSSVIAVLSRSRADDDKWLRDQVLLSFVLSTDELVEKAKNLFINLKSEEDLHDAMKRLLEIEEPQIPRYQYLAPAYLAYGTLSAIFAGVFTYLSLNIGLPEDVTYYLSVLAAITTPLSFSYLSSSVKPPW
jgi:hypothetical protein